MSRPIYEPSLQRTDARLGYGAAQLFRRPAPPSGTAQGVEWFAAESTTTWGTSLTPLNFDFVDGDYDNGTPTFGLNADDNLEIMKDGTYTIDTMLPTNPGDALGVQWGAVRIEIERLGGPTPAGQFNWTAPIPRLKTLYSPGDPWQGEMGDPYSHDLVNWTSGTFSATPTEFQVSGLRYLDGAPELFTGALVRLLVVRLGDPYS